MRLRLLVGIGLVTALGVNALSVASAYGKSEIVDYRQFLAKRTKKIKNQSQKKQNCTEVLSSEVIPFNKYAPQFVTHFEFLEEYFNSQGEFEYLFSSSTTPPLSRYSEGVWSRDPDLSGNHIFVLKTEKLTAKRATWNIQELRAEGRILSYTRVPVSQFFGVFRAVIIHIRGLERYSQSVIYDAPELSGREALSLNGPRHQLGRYIASWKTETSHEATLKYFLEDFLANRYQYPEDRSDLDRFYTQLENELLRYYSPEQVGSAMSSLRLRGTAD